MPANLTKQVLEFKKDTSNFIYILNHFKSKINYLSYKLNYPEAHTDLVIYLYELLPRININKFRNDEDLEKYIKRCIQNKSTKLFYKTSSDKRFILIKDNTDVFNAIDIGIQSDEYSNILFNDLVSLLKPNQQKLIVYKFYYQLSDIEIANILNISRQAVNKSLRNSLKKLKNELVKE